MSNKTVSTIINEIATMVTQHPDFVLKIQLFNQNRNHKLTILHPLINNEYEVYALSVRGVHRCKQLIEDYIKRMTTTLTNTNIKLFADYFDEEFEVTLINSKEHRIQMRHRESKKLVSLVFTLDTIVLYRHIEIAPTDSSVKGMKKLSIVHEIETYLRPTPMRILYERIETELTRPITDYIEEIESSDL